jgi:preprotein translocase subunit SecD
VLDPDQIVSASTVQGFDGRPAVLVELDEEGTRQLAELTAERVGETMALTLGGQLRMVPRVMEPITGGTLQLSLGEGEAMAEARDLTVLIEAPLGGRWTLLEVSAR